MTRFIAILVLLLFSFESFASSAKIQNVETKLNTNIWLIEDNSLPIISFKIAFRHAGSAYEPIGKSGTSNLLSNMLNKGAGKYSNLELKKILEDNAIYINFTLDKDNLYANLSTLKENKDKAFEILSLMLTKPLFDKKTFIRVKSQALDSVKKKMEKPNYIADLRWIEESFAGHQYGLPTRGYPETIENITIDDLKKFMNEHISLSNAVMSIVGNISKSETTSLFNQYLSKLPVTPVEAKKTDCPGIAYIRQLPEGRTIHIKKDIPQSVVIFGTNGISYADKDFYAAHIMNYILGGGGFESRLMNEIREKRGLAYSVYSFLTTMSYTSLLKGGLGTRNEKLDEALDVLKAEFKKMQKNGITSDELNSAKSYLTGSFHIHLDSNQKLVDFISFIQLEELGIDFMAKRNNYINKVSLEDVNRVAKRLLNPEDLIITIVGKKL